jgi:CRP-like cAMP-binding protein
MKSRYEVIKSSPLFSGLDEEAVKKIEKHFVEKIFSIGDNIVTDGEKGSSMYLLKSGSVVVIKKLTMLDDHQLDVKDKALVHLSADDNAFFGEMVICSGKDARSATVRAETDCVILEIDAESLRSALDSSAQSAAVFYRNMSEILTERLKRANGDVLKLTTALSLALDE